MENRKKTAGILLAAGVAAILLFFCGYAGYGPFDRSGWSATAEGAHCYLNPRGEALVGWQEVEGRTYYFSPEHSGAMATGWLEVEGKTYYLGADGQKTYGWLDHEGERYYFDDSGRMCVGWAETEDGTCYFDTDGTAYSGWLEDAAGKCYLENGLPCNGWLEAEEGTYFLDVDGRMHIGWLELADELYYFREDGTMAVGRVEIDGTAQHFTSKGKHFPLVNRWNPVSADYSVTLGEVEGFQMAEESCEPLKALLAACNEAGHSCKIRCGYRSFNFQTTVFQRKVDKLMAQGYSQEAAERETSYSIAIPGTSEHQLGLAVDFTCGQDAYAWLRENSWKYGFIMRYPFGKSDITGIYYEPWHYRYVGEELAAELYTLGLCVEEYVSMLTAEEN